MHCSWDCLQNEIEFFGGSKLYIAMSSIVGSLARSKQIFNQHGGNSQKLYGCACYAICNIPECHSNAAAVDAHTIQSARWNIRHQYWQQ